MYYALTVLKDHNLQLGVVDYLGPCQIVEVTFLLGVFGGRKWPDGLGS